ncbi:MAG: ABC transporter, partial [Actinomycetota bacterium]|nr:ABC transporter [Actinomycetota bacterium]
AWLAGRLLALLSVVAAALLIALAASVLAALAMSRVRGLDTTAWWTSDGLTSAAVGYLNALLAAAFFGVAGTALGVLVRSTPVALAAGIAWMGPLEHLVQKASGTATRVLPGLLFDAVARGGVPDVGYSQALLTATAYAGIALLVAFASFARRDVTT